jgi:hypothetical protein
LLGLVHHYPHWGAVSLGRGSILTCPTPRPSFELTQFLANLLSACFDFQGDRLESSGRPPVCQVGIST